MFERKKLGVVICCFLLLFFISTLKVKAAPPSIQRFGGSDRYETSVQVSKNNWNQSDYVVIVSGENFPDALSAAPLAKKYNAPILLTPSDSLSNSVMQEIQRLNVKSAFIVGGSGAVSKNIENKLKSLNINCTRIQGQDRYETSVKVAQIIGTSNGVVLASGENFPDAVSIAPIAAAQQMPILLTPSSSLPDSVKNFISNNNPSKYYVVGGTASISDSAINNLNNYKRLSGNDRYATNTAVINYFSDDEKFNSVYLANGEGFADALSGSAVSARTLSPIILVNGSSTSEPIIQSNANTISTINMLGGTAVIPDTLVQSLFSIISSQGTTTQGTTTTSSTIEQGTTSSTIEQGTTSAAIYPSNSSSIFTGTNANFAWIWQLESDINNYGSIDNLISKLKSLGITNVCIKYHEGSSSTGGGINYRDAFLKYVKNFKDAGFTVGTWGYNYFNYVQDEANLINEALDNSDYYIFDAESDVAGKTSQAEQICQLVRSKHPNAVIGYTSYPVASYHQDIPYSVFNKYCDFASPQCYWGEMQWSINDCIDKMVQDYKDLNLNKPIYPSIETYNISSGDYNAYTKYNFNNTGYWDFDEIDSNFCKFKNN